MNENTKITLGLVIVLVSVASALAKTYFLADSSAQTLDQVMNKQSQYAEDISAIKADLAFIKQLMKEARENGSDRDN